MNKLEIHIVHKNAGSAKILEEILQIEGHNVTLHLSDSDFLEKLPDLKIDLLVSSYRLPNLIGDSFLELVFLKKPGLLVLFTSSIRDKDIIKNIISNDGTDFLSEPIVREELLARLETLWESSQKDEFQDNGEQLNVKDINLDTATRQVTKGKKKVALSPTEYKLFYYLLKNANKVLSREEIIAAVWDDNNFVSDRIVDVYIGYLREKLDNPDNPKMIITSPGFGYVIKL